MSKLVRDLWIASVAIMIAAAMSAPANAGKLPEKYPNIFPPTVQFGSRGLEPGSMVAPRGVAIGQDGTFFVADCDKNVVEAFDRKGALLWEKGQDLLNCPSGLAVDSKGILWVSDRGSGSLVKLSAEGKYEGRLAVAQGPNDPVNPTHLALDEGRGVIYVLDTPRDRILAIDFQGQLKQTIGGYGTATGRFANPSGIAVDGAGQLYVADRYNNRIQIFDAKGQFASAFGVFGSYPGNLAAPIDVALLGDEVLVADSVNHRIQSFSPDGKLLYHFGRHPTETDGKHYEGAGYIHYPQVLATDSARREVITCERFEGRCQVFNVDQVREKYIPVNDSAWWEKYPMFHYRSGCIIATYWMVTGNSPEVIAAATAKVSAMPGYVGVLQASERLQKLLEPEKDGRVELIATTEEDLHRVQIMQVQAVGTRPVLSFGTHGSDPGELKMPSGAALDPWGRVWVSDSGNHRVQVFTMTGDLLQVIGGPGTGEGQFMEPGSPTVDREGNVYVPDAGNNRVVVLDKTGKFVRQWGHTGDKPGEFRHVVSAAISPDFTKVFTLELHTQRIQVFDTKGNIISTWGKHGTAPGELMLPMHIAVSPKDNNVYVADDALDRITVFTQDGQLVRYWGETGTAPDKIRSPQGIAVGQDGRVWMIDYANHRGQTFNADGEWQFAWAEKVIAVKAGLQMPPSGGALSWLHSVNPSWLIVIGSAMVVVLGGLVVWILRYRRKPVAGIANSLSQQSTR